jgi:Flp pilus assembly protein CpaB
LLCHVLLSSPRLFQFSLSTLRNQGGGDQQPWARSWPSAGSPWWLPVASERTTTAEPVGSPASPPSGRPAPARRPRRLTARAVVPVLLAVIAGGFAYEALQDRAAMTSIVVAASLVPAGSPVNGNDTRLVKVHATDVALTKGLVPPSELGEGWVAAVAVQAGQPITLSELERPPSGPALGEMSIAVPVQQAAGGTIGPGDLVDVIAAQGTNGAYYVAQSLRVLAVAPTSASSGVLSGGTTDYFVVVAVGKQTALRIAAAVGAQGSGGAGSDIEIVRSTGETEVSQGINPVPSHRTAGPPRLRRTAEPGSARAQGV